MVEYITQTGRKDTKLERLSCVELTQEIQKERQRTDKLLEEIRLLRRQPVMTLTIK